MQMLEDMYLERNCKFGSVVEFGGLFVYQVGFLCCWNCLFVFNYLTVIF